MAIPSFPRASVLALLAVLSGSALASCKSNQAATSGTSSGSSSSGSSGTASGSSSSSGTPIPFQADPPYVYVAKVKNILTGMPPTDAEVQAVTADPTQLGALIDTWMTDPAYAPLYQAKMRVFFELAFQQTQITSASFIDMLPPNGLGPGPGVPLLVQNLTESFARTMLQLIADGQPFNQAMTTKTLMMTPAMMEFYAFLDTWHADDETKTADKILAENPTATTLTQGTAGLANVTLAQSVDPTSPHFLHFYNPDVAGLTYPMQTSCNGIDPIVYPKVSSYTINWLFYGAVYNHPDVNVDGGALNCGSRATPNGMLFAPSDFTTWKMVTIRPPAAGEATTRFFDLPTLRTLNELVINTPRLGFFSTPAFFANWSTNSSNQMRVTLNQALIVATGTAIDGTDTTTLTPGVTVGLDPAHAPLHTACYGCHQLLDPTRAILESTWTYPYYTQEDPAQIQVGAFMFQGVQNTSVKTIDDFATILATHPLLPAAWAKKLYYYANSYECPVTNPGCIDADPEFQRVVSVFKGSLSWNALVKAMLSSPLTTNASPTTLGGAGEVVAVSRRDHLCAAIDNRLGLVDACGLQVTTPASTITKIVAGLPSDGYGRGAALPVLPNAPTLFYRAGLENICEALADLVIDNPSAPAGAKTWTSSATPTAALADFVSIILAITPSDARSAPAAALLQAHFSSAMAIKGTSTTSALRSTFTTACLAPSFAGIGM
jgi:hypothetical protein